MDLCCWRHLSSFYKFVFHSVQFSSVAQLCLTLCDLMNCSTPGLPVHHQLPEFAQSHVHWVSDAIQPSHSRSSPSNLKKKMLLFGCTGPSLLWGLFSGCGEQRLLSSYNAHSCLCGGFSCCRARAVGRSGFSSCGTWAQLLRLPGSGAQAQWLWYVGLVAPRHVGSSCIRDRIHVFRIGRRIPYTESPGKPSLFSYSK